MCTTIVHRARSPALFLGTDYVRSHNIRWRLEESYATQTVVSPEGLGLQCIYTTMYKCVFFAHRIFFSPPAAGRFSSSRFWGKHEARPNATAQVWALAEVRGTRFGCSKSQLTAGRHSEHVEPSRPMQTYVQVEKMSDSSCDI